MKDDEIYQREFVRDQLVALLVVLEDMDPVEQTLRELLTLPEGQ